MNTHLRSVEAPDEPAHTESGLPDFEGQRVDLVRLKLTAASDLDIDQDAIHIDDVVRLFVEGRVTRVDHVVDDKSGMLKRVHTIKVSEAIKLPDTFDTGVFDG